MPGGHTRSITTTDPSLPPQPAGGTDRPDSTALDALLSRTAAARIPVGRRPLADYDLAAGLPVPGVN
ncbi:hypothetical protein [Streptomyces sp. NPDC127084]|uniref:hypothetical protein n=1 Tax=Streptomyces sp. NPDC127084 TaxID=3347133 RepID=UPI003654342A